MKDGLYKISNFDRIDPFLMSITSGGNHWMYLSSSGCLTAGRQKAEFALFPYVTDDLLHKNAHFTGPVTAIHIEKNNKKYLWQPFSYQLEPYKKEQNLYKNSLGNRVVFEEINHSLGITFFYSWQTSEKFGFVRKSSIKNNSEEPLNIRLVDGLRNILPAGIELRTQQEMSNLANAYKVSECNNEFKYSLYYMNALLMDRPEPGESLFTNIVWSNFNKNYQVSVDEKSLSEFISTNRFSENHLLKGKPGSYLIHIEEKLNSNNQISWYIVADVQKSQKELTSIIVDVKDSLIITEKLEKSINKTYLLLEKYIGLADGFQCTRNNMNDLHHSSNVTYNILRGGVFIDNYNCLKNNLINFIQIRNKNTFEKYKIALHKLPNTLKIKDIKSFADNLNDSSLMRICREYLPLTLGRRHGDPSRPWNHFDIRTKNDKDQPILYYEGNWRDIFQNWEALSLSYPQTLESIICVFLNATTADGYNPYRITSDGIDWEIIDPDDTWSHIGYWNDHQIIYLLKLLEHITNYDQEILPGLFNKTIFSYANIPYELKKFEQIIKNPKETLDFNFNKNCQIMELVGQIGSDGRLILDNENTVYHVNLCEKILVLILAKICNYIPGAGIWLNTQRPEWNDANNALVGNGTSMVTVYYLRRFLSFFEKLLNKIEIEDIIISSEVWKWFEQVDKTVAKNKFSHHSRLTDKDRMSYTFNLGKIFENYRETVYSRGFTNIVKGSVKKIKNFIIVIAKQLDDTIQMNRSNNGLFEAYNTIQINSENQSINVKKLDLMLEGQVAALSNSLSEPSKNVQTLEALFSSDLYRQDMKSFILYPRKKITPFLKKNIIDPTLIKKSKILKDMIDKDNSLIVEKDNEGTIRFNPKFRNVFDLRDELQKLFETNYSDNVTKKEIENILQIFENVFDHRNFTGRSGTMFSYEGIGSIYWHMVSKLLLAIQENYFTAKANYLISNKIVFSLGTYYYKVRNGLSAAKTPEEYGAFPFDPYSHTPSHSGAQQPGMTGQVKEEILTRFGELGCVVKNGTIEFDLSLLKKDEFLSDSKTFTYYDISKQKKELVIQNNQLAYTFCQVPIIYNLSKNNHRIEVTMKDGSSHTLNSYQIPKNLSQSIFNRLGEVQELCLFISTQSLFNHKKL